MKDGRFVFLTVLAVLSGALFADLPAEATGQTPPIITAPAEQTAAATERDAPATEQTTPAAENGTPAADEQPTVEQMMRFLASDELAGRDAASPSYGRAADYVVQQLEAAGLEPAGDNGTWFQSFSRNRQRIEEQHCALAISTDGNDARQMGYGQDYLPFRFSAAGAVGAAIVFAGYGISSADHKYDDYAGIDVEGKVVLILRYEPGEKDEQSPFNGLGHTRHATFGSKVALAQQKGAAGVIIATGPHYHPTGQGFYAHSAGVNNLEVTIPVVQVSQEVAKDIVATAGRDLSAVQKGIDTNYRPDSFAINKTAAGMVVRLSSNAANYRNVVGRLPGGNLELADQVVVIGAHLDHIGTSFGYDSRNPASEFIFNGADDNASGVVAMIVAARQLASADQKPERSILFMAFDGEEQGLLGSRYYVSRPLVPLDKTVAMLNLDMVGRAQASSVYAFFSHSADSLRQPLQGHARLRRLNVLPRYGDSMPTDSASFAMVGVPVVNFTTGIHEDYHEVEDTAEKINFADLERIGQVTADLARTAAASRTLKRGPAMFRQRTVRPPVQPPAEQEGQASPSADSPADSPADKKAPVPGEELVPAAP